MPLRPWNKILSLAVLCAGLLACLDNPLLGGPNASAVAQTSPTSSSEGLVTIESDSQEADNHTGIVTAKGNVRITYPDKRMVATARQAQYFPNEGRLVLSGDVDVIDADGQRIRAERLVYLLDQERLSAQPSQGKQVTSKFRLTPTPGQQRTGPPIP